MGIFRYLLETIGLGGSNASQTFRKEGGPMVFRFLQDGSVRQELGLSIEQIGLIGKYTRESRQKHRKTYAKLRGLEPDKRRPEVQKLMYTMAEDAVRNITKAGILTESQKTRLRQMVWQHRGVGAFRDPSLVKALGLSEGQQHAILNVIEDMSKKLKELMKGDDEEGLEAEVEGERREKAPPTDEQKEKATALRKEAIDRVIAVLNEAQQKTWEELKGAPFEVTLDGPGGAGGGELG
jgi:hypothetical protein